MTLKEREDRFVVVECRKNFGALSWKSEMFLRYAFTHGAQEVGRVTYAGGVQGAAHARPSRARSRRTGKGKAAMSRKHQHVGRISVLLPVTVERLVGTDDTKPTADSAIFEAKGPDVVHRRVRLCCQWPRRQS